MNYTKAIFKHKADKNLLHPTFFVFTMICIALLGVNSMAATYYLDAENGNDLTGNGSSQMPWKSLQKSLSVKIPGDTFLLRSGNYGTFSSNPPEDKTLDTGNWTYTIAPETKWTTWKAENENETPVFSKGADSRDANVAVYLGHNGGSGSTKRPTAYVFDGIKIEGTFAIYHCFGVRINNCQITGPEQEIENAYAGIAIGYSGDIKIENSKIHHCRTHGISAGSVVNNLEIKNCEIFDVGSDNITLRNTFTNCENILIENNDIHSTNNWLPKEIHPDGIQFWGTSPNIFKNCTIRGNKIHDLYDGAQGFSNGGSTMENLIFENNLVYNIASNPVICSKTLNSTIRNNTIIGYLRINILNENINIYNNIIGGEYMFGNGGSTEQDMTTLGRHDNNIAVKAPYRSWNTEYPTDTYYEKNSYFYTNKDLALSQLFVDHQNRDYHLKDFITKAVDFGSTTLSAPLVDLDNSPRDTVADAGCFEYDSHLIIDPIENKTIHANEKVAFDISASDQADHQINFTAKDLPEGATFQDKKFQWTPSANQVGVHKIEFLATCSEKTKNKIVTITVLELPKITSVAFAQNSIAILFDQQITTSSAQTISNFSLSNASINSATLSENILVLSTSPLENGNYTLSVTGIEDAFANKCDPVHLNYSYDPSLTGFWKLDKNTGITVGTILDNHQDNMIEQVWAQEENKDLWSFDNESYVKLADFQGFSGSTSTTIAFAAKQKDLATKDYVIWADKNLFIEFGDSHKLKNSASLSIAWNLNGSWGNVHAMENILDTDVWHHWAFTFDNGTTKIYKDGLEIYTGIDSRKQITDLSNDCYIGSRVGVGSLNALVDNMRTYNRALSAEEILELAAPEQAAMLNDILPQTIQENSQLNLSIISDSAAEQQINLTAQNLPENATLDNGILTWTPNYEQAGLCEITFNADNGIDYETQTLAITVENVNRKPQLENIENKTVAEGGLIEFTVTATDPDNDQLTLTADNLPQGAVFANSIFQWTPDVNQAGSYQVTFNATDNTDTESKAITITVNNTNRSPVIAAIDDKTVAENQNLNFTVTANDPDSDNLTITAENLPQGATFTNGIFNWKPSYSQAGSYGITFNATDGQLNATQNITIAVININRAPAIAAITDKTVTENSQLTFAVQASDPDADAITLSVANIPTGAKLIGTTFSWKPDYTQAGTYNVTFTADDGIAATSKTAKITVFNQNRSPQFAINSAFIGLENSLLSFDIAATDPDGDHITYTASSMPAGANFAGNTFTWIPTFAQAGNYVVTFTATDGLAQTSTNVNLTISNLNRAPEFETIGNQTVEQNSQISFPLIATDLDNDNLTFTANQLPVGAAINNNAFTWTPDSTQSGQYNITFSVSDGATSTDQTVTITVNQIVAKPELLAIKDKIVLENNTLQFALQTTETTEDLTYTATDLPEGATLNENIFNWTPISGQNGTYQVTFTVRAGQHTDSQTATITVEAHNSLVAYWNFDEINADIVPDYSGNQNDLTLTDIDILNAQGRLETDGTKNTGYAIIDHNDMLDGMDELVLSAWAKKATPTTGGYIFHKYLAYSLSITDNLISVGLVNQAGEKLNFNAMATHINDTEWHHYLLSYDQANVKLFVDGILIKTQEFTGTIAQQPKRDLYIGKIAWGTSFNGAIDEARIYNRSLDDAQIADLSMNFTEIVIAYIDDKLIAVDNEIQFDVYAVDPESAELTCSTNTLPDGATFDNETWSFKWTPAPDQVGQHTINFNVTNGTQTKIRTVNIVVTNGSKLIGQWQMNESEGTTAADSSIYQNHANLIGSAAFNTEAQLDIYGTDGALEIPVVNLDINNTTIMLSAYNFDLTGTRYFIGHSVGSWSSRIQLYSTDGQLCLGLGDKHALATNIETLVSGTWYQLALKWNGTSYAVYVDGIEKAAGTYTGLLELNSRLDIGNTGNTAFRLQEGLNGIIDNVRIYKESLDSTTIEQYSNAIIDGLVGQWEFNDYTTNIAQDSSESQNTATIIDNATITEQGLFAMDGTSDALQFSTQNCDANNGTVALWAYPTNAQGTHYLFGHSIGTWSNRIQLYTVNGKLCLGLGDSHFKHRNIETFALDTWHHVALTWDGTNYAVYVNGIEKAAGTYTGLTELETFADFGNTGNITFRADEAFEGFLDNVQIYNQTLTPEKIFNLTQ